MRLPFEKFIISLLLRGKKPQFICDKLRDFGYYASIDDVTSVYTDMRLVISDTLKGYIENNEPINLLNEHCAQFAKHFGVYEYLDYLNYVTAKQAPYQSVSTVFSEEKPQHYKWFDDIMWIHKYKDTMSIVNIFLFNNEELSEISDILSFKYKKKVSLEALDLYRSIFWDTSGASASEIIKLCTSFKDTPVILKTMANGEQEVSTYKMTSNEDIVGGCITFHPIDYIKWKIGYRKISVPKPKDFINRIKTDSYYKYHEAMNIIESTSQSNTDGNVAAGDAGVSVPIDQKTINHHNISAAQAKMAKHWADMYIKAHTAIPDNEDSDKSFFDRLDQYEIEFDNEKVALAHEIPGLWDDIKNDRNV